MARKHSKAQRRDYRKKVNAYANGGMVRDARDDELPEGILRDARDRNEVSEMSRRERFNDSGRRIPGRLKGLNDKNKDRPALIQPVIGREDD